VFVNETSCKLQLWGMVLVIGAGAVCDVTTWRHTHVIQLAFS